MGRQGGASREWKTEVSRWRRLTGRIKSLSHQMSSEHVFGSDVESRRRCQLRSATRREQMAYPVQ